MLFKLSRQIKTSRQLRLSDTSFTDNFELSNSIRVSSLFSSMKIALERLTCGFLKTPVRLASRHSYIGSDAGVIQICRGMTRRPERSAASSSRYLFHGAGQKAHQFLNEGRFTGENLHMDCAELFQRKPSVSDSDTGVVAH